MKRLLMIGGFILVGAGGLKAEPLVTESPIKDYSTPATVAVSTSTLTKIPTSQTTGRLGVYVGTPNTVAGFLGNRTSTALASTIRPIQISSTTVPVRIDMRDDVCLWMVALFTGAATADVHVQEIKR